MIRQNYLVSGPIWKSKSMFYFSSSWMSYLKSCDWALFVHRTFAIVQIMRFKTVQVAMLIRSKHFTSRHFSLSALLISAPLDLSTFHLNTSHLSTSHPSTSHLSTSHLNTPHLSTSHISTYHLSTSHLRTSHLSTYWLHIQIYTYAKGTSRFVTGSLREGLAEGTRGPGRGGAPGTARAVRPQNRKRY